MCAACTSFFSLFLSLSCSLSFVFLSVRISISLARYVTARASERERRRERARARERNGDEGQGERERDVVRYYIAPFAHTTTAARACVALRASPRTHARRVSTYSSKNQEREREAGGRVCVVVYLFIYIVVFARVEKCICASVCPLDEYDDSRRRRRRRSCKRRTRVISGGVGTYVPARVYMCMYRYVCARARAIARSHARGISCDDPTKIHTLDADRERERERGEERRPRFLYSSFFYMRVRVRERTSSQGVGGRKVPCDFQKPTTRPWKGAGLHFFPGTSFFSSRGIRVSVRLSDCCWISTYRYEARILPISVCVQGSFTEFVHTHGI